MRIRAILFLGLALVASCAAKTLDATDVESFESSFAALVAELSEAERLAVAGALLTLAKDATVETVLPAHIVRGGKPAEELLKPEVREAFNPELVQTLGGVLDGKSAAEVLALAEAVAAKAEANAAARLEGRLAELEQALARAREKVAAEKAKDAGTFAALDRQAAILDGVEARVAAASLSKVKGNSAQGAFELEVVNGSGATLSDAKLQLFWHAKDATAKVKRFGLKALKAVDGKGLAPQAGVTLAVERVRLSFTKLRGGLDSPDQLSFSAVVDEVVTGEGEKIGRRSLENRRRAAESGNRGLAKAQREVQRLQEQIEAAKAKIEGRS